MAIQAYDVTSPWDGSVAGAVIVDTVTSRPLNISVAAFNDAEDADEFLGWAASVGFDDLRRVAIVERDALVIRWGRGGREKWAAKRAADDAAKLAEMDAELNELRSHISARLAKYK